MRRVGRLSLAFAVSAAALAVAPAASADPAPNWAGWYKITFHTDQKSGTSVAAKQSEQPYTAWY